MAFADHYSTPPVQNSSALDERSQFDAPSVPSNVPQFGYGKSAFRPVGYGVQNRPSELMPKVTQASRPPNISNHHDQENRLQNPSSDSKVGAAFVAETSSVNGMPFPHESITGNKFSVFSRTPDANKSGDLNSSNLTGPSPTVFIEQNLDFVARFEKSISFIFLSIDSFEVDKKPDKDCSGRRPFICENNYIGFRCRSRGLP